jgi:hypothetical protein
MVNTDEHKLKIAIEHHQDMLKWVDTINSIINV